MTPSTSSTPSSFLIVSYNILAQSLGSNCIPWVTRISDEWIERLKNNNNSAYSPNNHKTAWSDIKSALSAEYKAHFHKNPNTQSDPKSYHFMRRLWSTKSLKSAEELKRFHPNLDCVAFESEWKVSYKKRIEGNKDGEDGKEDDTEGEGDSCVATTMGGVLRRELGDELGNELFHHLMELEENVYDWKKSRGPKIFRRVTSNWTTMMDVSSPADVGSPSIICLQEYDVHHMEAVYHSNNKASAAAEEEETFAQAMKIMGYDGVFFPGASGKSGLATYWKEDEFQLDMDQNEEDNEEQNNFPDTILLGTNWKQSAFNCDLMERYHCRAKHPPQQQQHHQITFMPELDRKNVGYMRLKHIQTNRILWVFNTHFMTISRDNERWTYYPGEMRARELETVSKLVQRHVNRGDRIEDVILAGDWNTDVGNLNVLKGCIPHSGLSSSREEENEIQATLLTSLNISTGFSIENVDDNLPSTSQLDWKSNEGGGAILRDVFESVHYRESHSINPSNDDKKESRQYLYATSQNSDRREWIDHIWYSVCGCTQEPGEEVDGMVGVSAKDDKKEKQFLRIKTLSNTMLPWRPIPDLEEPSDHIPIGVELEFMKT